MRSNPWDNLIEDRRVLCENCALARNGLIVFNCDHLDIMTDREDFDNFDLAYVTFYFYNDIDYENYVAPYYTNENLLLPTRERAIIDYARNETWCDEGILIEALKNYLFQYRDDLSVLFEVAKFYNYSEDKLRYWLEEAEVDEEI